MDQTINKFFIDSYNAPELEGADWLGTNLRPKAYLHPLQTHAQGVLINTEDLTSVKEPSKTPIMPPTSYPFQGYSVDRIVAFARANFNGVQIVSRVITILDERILEDETCLLVTKKELAEDELLTVRSDFRSALVTLNVKNLGVGGDEHFEPTGSNGVIRIGNS